MLSALRKQTVVTPAAEPAIPPRIQATGHEKTRVRWRCFVLQASQFGHIAWDTVNSALAHRVPRLGASLAFYSALSLAPLLIVILGITGVAFSREAAAGYVVYQIQNLVGKDGAEVVRTLINGAQKPTSGVIATVLGLFALFFGATSVVAEMKDAMNIVWEVPPRQSARTIDSILDVVKTRLLSFAMVLGVGFLLLVSLAVNAALSAFGSYYSRFLPTSPVLLQALDIVVSFVAIGILFAALFKFLPDTHIDWTDVALGAAITSALFTLGKFLIGLYLGRAGFSSTYGAAGSLVILLIWIYYSAQIFYLGAEFTHVYAEFYGSQPSVNGNKQVEIIEPLKG